MRKRLDYLVPVLGYLGALFWIFGFVLLIPLIVLALDRRAGQAEVSPLCFLVPAAVSWGLGFVLKGWKGFGVLDS